MARFGRAARRMGTSGENARGILIRRMQQGTREEGVVRAKSRPGDHFLNMKQGQRGEGFGLGGISAGEYYIAPLNLRFMSSQSMK